jgi:hypothetical protein
MGFCVLLCAWDVCAGGACRYSCKERDYVCPIVSKTDKVPQFLLIFSTVRLHEGAFVRSLGNGGTESVPPLPDHRPATYWVQHTTSCISQSNAPEDGQNCCPKHVELIWIYQ